MSRRHRHERDTIDARFGRLKARGLPAFGDGFGLEEMAQVVASARLAVRAGEVEAAEGLHVHQRAGDLAIEIEIPDLEFMPGALQMAAIVGVDAPCQPVDRAVRDL